MQAWGGYYQGMLTIHLVRHGDTLQAAEGILSGDLDPPLTDSGRAQAERLVRFFEPLALTAIYCSPKERAQMTAEPTARACRKSPVLADGLREISYGRWEGMRETDLKAKEPAAFEAWHADPAMQSPPGGETAFAIAARALPVIVDIQRAHRAGHVMVVSHKATIRIIACALLGIPLARFRSHVACPTASITSFEFVGGVPMLVGAADVHHLG
jgi:probable phosphoglycerate mutase